MNQVRRIHADQFIFFIAVYLSEFIIGKFYYPVFNDIDPDQGVFDQRTVFMLGFPQGLLGHFALEDLAAQLFIGLLKCGCPLADPLLQFVAGLLQGFLGIFVFGNVPENFQLPDTAIRIFQRGVHQVVGFFVFRGIPLPADALAF